jgi:dsRNA-specific ribonuclease
MANDEYFTQLQNRIGYKFKDVSVLERALIAPGAEGNKEGDNVEREKYDGNRKLAKLGDSILHLIVVFKSLYEEEAELSEAKQGMQ